MIWHYLISTSGFPGNAKVKNPPANAGDIRVGVISGLGRSPETRRKWQFTPVFMPGEFHGQRNYRA